MRVGYSAQQPRMLTSHGIPMQAFVNCSCLAVAVAAVLLEAVPILNGPNALANLGVGGAAAL